MRKIVNLLGTGDEFVDATWLWIVTLQYPTIITAQETEQTNKQNNLLTLTISCEKKSRLIRSKKKSKTKSKKKKKRKINK